MSRFEPVLVALFLAAWAVELLAVLGLVDLAGSLELELYPLYSAAAAAGWASGNVYVARAQGLPPALRRRILLVYFLGPLGPISLLRAMATIEAQRAAPLVPLYSFGVFTVLFLVPVLIPRAPARRSVRVGDAGARRGPAQPDQRDDRDGRDGRDDDPPVVP